MKINNSICVRFEDFTAVTRMPYSGMWLQPPAQAGSSLVDFL
jgi:hypothetical protein